SSVISLFIITHLFCLLIRPPPSSTLFPYTTLFRSQDYYSFAAFFSKVGRKTGAQPGEEIIYAKRGLPTATNKKTRQSVPPAGLGDRKSTRLNSSHVSISYAVFCLKKKKHQLNTTRQ